jgi:serine/threonine protein kinase
MSDQLHVSGGLSPAQLRHVEQVCARFEDAWKNGQRPQIDDYLGATPEPERAFLVRELLALEVAYGRVQQATTISVGHRQPTPAQPLANAQPAPAAAPAFLDFLEPPQQPGDLGRLGHYRVLAKIGAGGMGLVFRAFDTELGREVAVKVILPDACFADAEARFEREAQAMAKIVHDHVVAIHRFGRLGRVLYLEMPLLHGESLHDRLQRQQQLPIADVLKIGCEMAEGLAAAHAAGLIHRDVKPGNVFLSQEHGGWRVRLLDLGLARRGDGDNGLTRGGQLLGTPGYMSPEQAQAAELDTRSDLFSLGVVLYRMASGTNPFADPSLTAMRQKIAGLDPPPLAQGVDGVPPGLAQLIARLLAKDPQQRPASAAETARQLRALQAALESTDGRSAPPTQLPPLTTPRWRLGVLIAAVTVGAAALVLLTTYSLGLWSQPPAVKPSKPAPAPPVVVRLGLQLKLLAYKKDNPHRLFSLDEPHILPLREGDALRIEVYTARPAYFYVLNLDAEGKVWPMYPWRDNHWDDVAEEKPRDFFCIPDPSRGDAAPLQAGPSGIESVVVLARAKPLTADERQQLRDLFHVCWQKDQGTFDPLRAAVTIDAERMHFADIRDADIRGAIDAKAAVALKDPVLRLRNLLHGEMRALEVASCGVCYTFKGD